MSLQTLIAENIASGLVRKSITKCSRWAEKYRIMSDPFPGQWTFDHHPWTLEMHDAEEDLLLGQKAAQMGYTEWAMNMAFFNMDINSHDVLYILPSSDDASEFSSGRFDPALELSPHLRNFFANVNNVSLKRAGSNILYIRGSRSRSKLKSIPTAVIIYDEVDEMMQENIALSEHRQSGQIKTLTLKLSTPTLEDFGINKAYKLSSQDHFFFKCPHCGRFIELTYPECIVITAESLTDPRVIESYYKCNLCNNKLDHEEKINFLKHKLRGGTAHFIETKSNGYGHGFHINQMYSMAKAGRPENFAKAQLKSLSDVTYEQEFYNSVLARTHTVEGAKVTEQHILACMGEFKKGPSLLLNGIITMGIDVGSVLHIIIKEYFFDENSFIPGLAINDVATARLLYEGTSSGAPNDFDEAYDLFAKYQCRGCVVDAEPERRAALQFAQRLWGRVLVCDYQWSQSGKEATINEDECSIKVNRTAWMDTCLGRYKNGTIKLPVDITEQFKNQIKEPVRVYKEDKWGNKYGVYVNVNADHFAHADLYSEVALPLAFSFARNQDIHGMY